MDAQALVLDPSANAHDNDILVAEHTAVSRLRPIQDGLDAGRSTGVVPTQDWVAPRPTELGQCSDSVGRGSTLGDSFGTHNDYV
jgi:hypothetical protein